MAYAGKYAQRMLAGRPRTPADSLAPPTAVDMHPSEEFTLGSRPPVCSSALQA